MRKSIIVAMNIHQGIGYQGQIPWYISSDLRRFRQLTTGHHVIFGRKTYESIGKPLPQRKIIVLTSDNNYPASDAVLVTNDLEKAYEFAIFAGETELFIGGGENIYQSSLDQVDRIYLTYVHTDAATDRFFPLLNSTNWETKHVEHTPRNEKNEFDATFLILDRRQT